jgi:hypothetical protein
MTFIISVSVLAIVVLAGFIIYKSAKAGIALGNKASLWLNK